MTAEGKEGQALGLIGHCRNCGHRDPEVDQGSLKPRWAPPHLAFAPYLSRAELQEVFVWACTRADGSVDQETKQSLEPYIFGKAKGVLPAFYPQAKPAESSGPRSPLTAQREDLAQLLGKRRGRNS